MTDAEKKVLAWLADQCDEYSFPFKPICEGTELDAKVVRRACRSLKRKGLTEFNTGLWCEFDDKPAGSGYRATEAGRREAEKTR